MKHLTLITFTLVLSILVCGCTREQPNSVPSVDTTEGTIVETRIPATEPDAPKATDSTEQTSAEETSEVTEAKHTHDYTFKVSKQPTCTHSGIRTYTCRECGATYTENIKPLDHAFVIVKVEPDCLNSGYTSYHCKECGYAYNEDIRPALGHLYGPAVTIQNPTKTSTGLAEKTCARCGAVERVTLPCLTPDN